MKKKQLAERIDSSVLEKCRDLVYWEPGLTFNQFIEKVLREALKQWNMPIKKRPTR